MSAFGIPKFSQFVVGFASLLSLAGAVIVGPVQAAVIDFRDWRPLGDVDAQIGSLSMSTNALHGDDDLKNDNVISPDTDFNFSGNPAIGISQLATHLKLPPSSLNFTPSKPAHEGSGSINTQLSLTHTTTLSFDWTFFTNETAATNEKGEIDSFPDYAFIAINGVIKSLSNALDSLTPSDTTYHSQISGKFNHLLAAGVYTIAFGVLDVGNVLDVRDRVVSSALMVNKAKLISPTPPNPNPIPVPNPDLDPNPDLVTIPEPSSALALLLCSGLGVGLKLWKSRSV